MPLLSTLRHARDKVRSPRTERVIDESILTRAHDTRLRSLFCELCNDDTYCSNLNFFKIIQFVLIE